MLLWILMAPSGAGEVRVQRVDEVDPGELDVPAVGGVRHGGQACRGDRCAGAVQQAAAPEACCETVGQDLLVIDRHLDTLVPR